MLCVVGASMYVADGIANDRIFGLKSMKSILLAVLMISMSLSVGLVELNKSPWLVEDAESELEDINKPMHTTAPSISYSPSTLSLVNNTAMTPTTPTNAGGDFTVGVAAHIGATSGFDMYETFTSMGIDSNDDVHFSYHISSMYGKDLGYSTNSGGSWANTTIDSTGDVGMHTSLAIDSNDVVHISYTDMTNSDLKYATCSSSCTSSTSWTNTTVDTAGGEDTSIAIDSNNDVHISYYDDDNDELKYATCSSSCSSSSSWTTTSVDTSGIGDNSDTQDRTSIAIDSNDELHVSYGDKTNSKLKYATCSSSCSSSSSWSSTTLISTSANTPNNMAIDSNDNLHISFKSTGLRYASCSSSCSTASSWTFITIDTGTQAGRYNSIALDSNDGVHISYQSDYSISSFPLVADLKYATCASSCSAASSWYNHTIDSSVPVNYEAIGLSMGIDSDNKSHIIYQRVYNSSWEIAYTGTGSNGYSVSPDLPSGLILNWVNGTISGTPTSFSSSTTYTITAKNAYGSTTTTLTISVNTPPLISYDLGTGGTVYIVQNTPMSSLSPTLTTGFSAPTSCSHTGLPSGLLLSSTCVLSGTPTTLGSTTLTITPSNIAGSGTATSFTVNVNASGGSIIINTTSTEANLGIAISNITMSYTHTASVQNWTSGVTNTTIEPVNTFDAISRHEMDSGLHGDIAIVYSIKRGGASSASLTLLYKWNGAWTESTIDSSVDTEVPSVAIDRQGALHIGYVDKDNSKLKYATNATGSWVIETLGDAATDSSAQTATSVHLVTNAVHIMAVNDSTSNAGVKHYTNETGAWLNSTISDPLEDEGYGVQADIDPDGNLHVVFRREDGSPDDLILASRINGFWQNQTITTELYNGADAGRIDMDIDSQGQIHVVYQNRLNLGKRLSHGVLTSVNPGVNWDLNDITNVGFWPALAIDLNDDLHVSYHIGSSAESKDQWYVTNTSGSWNSPIETSATAGSIRGGFFGDMAVDSNNDVFVVALGGASCLSCEIRLTRIQGTGIGQAMNPIFEVSPPLPDGLNMNWHNGTISGTPTETYGNTTHTVTVTAFGATTTETFTLMVIEAPDISYGQSSYTFTKNSLVSGVTPTNVGGAPDSWGISPDVSTSIPGLSFNTATGAITGTPTGIHSATTFTVWANNSAGDISTTISITVQDEDADISYAGSPFTFTKNSLVSGATPTNAGGAPDSWAIDPEISTSIPGLSFNTATGEITGTPTGIHSATTFTVWANNSAGDISTTISITVQDEDADISYANSPFTFTKNEQITGETPTNVGGAPDSWAIDPEISTSIPGLSFNTATGAITGTPTGIHSATTFTVWANNSAGDISTTISITVQDEAADISYANSPFMFTKNGLVSGVTATNVGGVPDAWAIDPEISTSIPGLSFNTATGAITGTPTGIHSATTFTVWANNSAGDISTTISITVQDEDPDISYAGSPFTFTKNSLVSGATPTNVGGAPDSWGVSPDVPSSIPGLSFNTATGAITGTPTGIHSATTFTVWANNSAGDISTTISITVQDEAADISYAGSPFTFTKNEQITGETPTNVGGAPDAWAIDPEISTSIPGLSFNTATGAITGTPTGVHSATTLTVWANNSASDTSTTISITVQDEAADISYAGSPFTFTKNSLVSGATPTNVGGAPDAWAIDPDISTSIPGLSFNTATGAITGTPTGIHSATTFTVWANNSASDISTTISITVQDEDADISYAGSPFTFTKNSLVSGATPTNVGGAPDAWAIDPEISTSIPGLSFNTATGAITGTPTGIHSAITFTVWANNSASDISTTISITVQDETADISYANSPFTFTKNEQITGETPTNVGGAPDSWGISPDVPSSIPGLSFNTVTGEITGTPTGIHSAITFTVWANNSAGDISTTISISVLDQVPMIAYVPSEELLLSNSTVLNMEPLSTGGAITLWSITPELSAGLFFDSSTGVLSGTPTEIKNRTLYKITAANGLGSMTVDVNITVEDMVYDLSISPLYLVKNEEMVSLEPTSTLSGAVYEISPELPLDLFLGPNNGTIWGTPTEAIPLDTFTIYANSSQLNDIIEVQIGVLEDTDLDGMPDQLPVDYDPSGGLSEDMDDDNDGFTDVEESDCVSLTRLMLISVPSDLDGDLTCDALDEDIDGDGLLNNVETNTSAYVDQDNTGTNAWNADTDGDGVCDGPVVPAMPANVCTAGPDAFPNDSAASIDTDNDGMPDQLDGVSTTGLTEDTDDDNDNWTDLDEAACGSTDSKDAMDTPLDDDGDGICDVLDADDDNDQWSDEDESACGTDSKDVASTPLDGDDDGICDVLDEKILGYAMNEQEAAMFEGYVDQVDFIIVPNLTGMEPGTWSIVPALPAGLEFNGTMARNGETGIISGIPTEASPMTNYTIYANNSQTGVQFTFELAILVDTDGDGLPDTNSTTGLETDLDDDNDGHLDEIEIKCGSDSLNPISVPNVDENGECITGTSADEDDSSGFSFMWCLPLILLLLLVFLLFALLLRDKVELVGPEPENTTAEPHFLSGLGTKEDPFVLRPIKALKPGARAETMEAISIINMTPEIVVNIFDLAEATNDKRFMMYGIEGASEGTRYHLEADEEGRLRIRFIFDDSINPTYDGGEYQAVIRLGHASVYFSWTVGVKKGKDLKKSEAKATKEVKAQTEADAKAAKEVKAQADADAKAAKEVKAQAEADAKAAKEVKAQAEADAKAAKEVKAQAEEESKAVKEAREKVDSDAKANAKKAAELERIAKRAESIDFGTLGIALSSEGDDLQQIKGVGPFIAEKLNALGIFTFEQVGNMTPEIEEQVNVAIEFFSGRIKRDEWAKQAKELSKK